jgi:hypothetical protein
MCCHDPDPSSSNPFAAAGVRPPGAKGIAPGGPLRYVVQARRLNGAAAG